MWVCGYMGVWVRACVSVFVWVYGYVGMWGGGGMPAERRQCAVVAPPTAKAVYCTLPDSDCGPRECTGFNTCTSSSSSSVRSKTSAVRGVSGSLRAGVPGSAAAAERRSFRRLRPDIHFRDAGRTCRRSRPLRAEARSRPLRPPARSRLLRNAARFMVL